MLIYIHVPFCQTRCHYCAFHSMPLASCSDTDRAAIMQDYTDTLLREFAVAASQYGSMPVQSVFFGGGTPSLLPPETIKLIMDKLTHTFKLSSRAEITLEANPESLRKQANLAGYLNAGVNRLSIGLQSLDDAALRMLGRPHKAMDSMYAISQARDAGFANIGVDLMWGLPGQGVRQWLQTLKDVTKLGPDHISTYGLTLENGTKLEEECESGRLRLPPERDQALMFMEGAATLEAHGYLHYEISNFARMGYQCRHNLGYWDGMDYLGFGPSSTSTVEARRWTNPASMKAWREAVHKGSTAQNVEILSPRTRALELIMLRLRTTRGMRLKAYRDFCGRDFLQDHQRFVRALHENALIRIRNGYLSLTRSGMLVSNSIISNLFEAVQNTLGDENIVYNTKALAEPQSGEIIGHDRDPANVMPVVWPEA